LRVGKERPPGRSQWTQESEGPGNNLQGARWKKKERKGKDTFYVERGHTLVADEKKGGRSKVAGIGRGKRKLQEGCYLARLHEKKGSPLPRRPQDLQNM